MQRSCEGECCDRVVAVVQVAVVLDEFAVVVVVVVLTRLLMWTRLQLCGALGLALHRTLADHADASDV